MNSKKTMKKIIILIILIKITFISISICQVDITYSNTNIPDPEFASAPYNKVTWQDRNGDKLWVADINPLTGLFYNFTIIDTNIVPMYLATNGPEWIFNANDLQILYAKWDSSFTVSKLARAWQDSLGNWQTVKLQNATHPNLTRVGPLGSLDKTGDYPLKIIYAGFTPNGTQVSIWRELNNPYSETQLPANLTFPTIMGIARWVENKELLISTYPDIHNIPQTVIYDIRNPSNSEQLTFSASQKGDSRMWQSANPSFNGRYMFFTTVEYDSLNWRGINVYIENQNGGWGLLNQIYPPVQSNYPYIISPEQFIVNGNSYISFVVTENSQIFTTSNTQVWVSPADLSLGAPFRVSNNNPMNRRDPEAYVGTNTAWIFYVEIIGNNKILHKCATGL